MCVYVKCVGGVYGEIKGSWSWREEGTWWIEAERGEIEGNSGEGVLKGGRGAETAKLRWRFNVLAGRQPHGPHH